MKSPTRTNFADAEIEHPEKNRPLRLLRPAYPWAAKIRRAAIAVFWMEMVFVAWTAFLGGLFQSEVSRLLMLNDKALHVTAFAVLTLTALSLWRPARLVVPVMLLWAAVVEVVQSQIPSRSASIYDLIASASGIAIGLTVYLLVMRFSPRSRLGSTG